MDEKTIVYFVGGLRQFKPQSESKTCAFYDLYVELKTKFKESEANHLKLILHSYRQSTFLPSLGKAQLMNSSLVEKEGSKELNKESSIPIFTDQSAEDLAIQLDEDIETAMRKEGAKKIIIIAYSAGSALVRRAILRAKNRAWEAKKNKAVAQINMISDEVSKLSNNDNPGQSPSKTDQIKNEVVKLVMSSLADSKERQITSSDLQPSWIDCLATVIQIGGMTLGWEFNSQMPKHYLWLGQLARPICPYWFPWQIYRGSKFITDTRIGLNRHGLKSKHKTFYILGTQDEFLSPKDAVEPGSLYQVEQDKANAPIPTYLEVSGFTHVSILKSKESSINLILEVLIKSNEFRADKLLSLMKQRNVTIAHHSIKERFTVIPKTDIDDYLDPMDNEAAKIMPNVKHVIIVLHGIRDNGFWTKRIAHRIKRLYRDHGDVKNGATAEDKSSKNIINNQLIDSLKVISLSYGYFSLWDFLRPGGRRQAVEWFQNVYADITALYPNAEVSFIGHSNGTYLGTHALQCENLTYRYMVLAGSVVRRDFWDKQGKRWLWKQKIKRLLNIQAVDDWIVGILPGGLETLPILGHWMDLGGLGAYGNPWLKNKFQQIRIVGDHGAGIVDTGWDQLANFVLHNDPLIPILADSDDGRVNRQNNQHPSSANAFLPAINRKSFLLNSLCMLFRPLGGLYIVLAVILSFSPFILVVWISLFPLLSHLLATQLPFMLPLKAFFHHTWIVLAGRLSAFNEALPPLIRITPFSLTPENGFAITLLAPLGFLVLLFIMWQLSTSVATFVKAREPAGISKGVFGLFNSIVVYPVLALLVAKLIACFMVSFQAVMALMLILSVISFSLLRRI